MSNPIVFRVREFNIICSAGADGEPVPSELRSLDGALVPARRAMALWRAQSMGSALARALHESRLVLSSHGAEHARTDEREETAEPQPATIVAEPTVIAPERPRRVKRAAKKGPTR